MNILTYEFIKKQLIIIVIILVVYLGYNLFMIYNLKQNKIELYQNYNQVVFGLSISNYLCFS